MTKAKQTHEIKRWTENLWDKHFGEAERLEGWHSPEEKAKINAANAAGTLWTATDCEGKMYLTNGYHYVNRLYYVVSKNPCPAGLEINIHLC